MGHNVGDSRLGWLGFAILFCCGVAAYAIKPPEKVYHIDCSIFDGYPIMQEVRPFLDDVQPPEQLDFKTRVAYVDDWTKRRAAATQRYDQLLEVCRVEFEQQQGGD